MGTPHNESNHASHPPSVTSDEDDLRGTGVHVSPHVSPIYSERGEPSQAGSSEFREEYIHLRYPNELADPEVDPSDSASRLDVHHRPSADASRSNSSRRDPPRPRTGPREAGLHRPREPPGENDSIADSTEEFIRQGGYLPAMPRPTSWYDNPGYTQSSSSGSHYPFNVATAPGGQIVHYAPQQMPVQYAPQPQYHQMAAPPPMYPHPSSHHGYPVSHHPPSHVGSPYTSSPFGPPSMMGYPGPPPSYFGPQYPQPYPHPGYMDSWRVHSPTSAHAVSPPASAPPSESEKPKVDPDEIAKRIEAIMLAQSERESEARMKRDEAAALAMKQRDDAAALAVKQRDDAAALAVKQAADEAAFAMKQAADEAAAKAERVALEQRIRQEAAASALKAAADAAAAEAERAVREQKIREEAAAAALKAAADAAAAKAERASEDAKIAEGAAAVARMEAEKRAAEEAAKHKEESEKKQKEAEEKLKEAEEAAKKAKAEAEEKLKEAEEAAKKAKAEAEEATKKAEAAAPPPEKKAPIRFHDAVGRKFNFPFDLCARWRGMESLINQAFQHVEVIGEHVQHGHYDLVGPTGEIILPALWEAIIEPDWVITMHMWPMPEKQEEEEPPMIPPPLDDLSQMLNMDEILNGPKEPRNKSRGPPKRSKSKPGGFSAWMLGGASSKKSLKGDKKPDVAAGSQHDAADQGTCIAM